MQYQTEIHIAPDRYVCLQLPDFIPAGRAIVTVRLTHPADDPSGTATDDDRAADGPTIAWWDEFDTADDPRRDR